MLILLSRVTYLSVGFSLCAGSLLSADSNLEFFERRIRPLLVEHCYECHGQDEPAADLRLDTRAGVHKGGGSGRPVVPGDPDASLLIRAVRYQDEELQMPPEDAGGRLTAQQIADLERWVLNGAVDPRDGPSPPGLLDLSAQDHWAFQPLQRPKIPNGPHPIDYLVEQQLEKQELTPTPRADARTLVRRAVYDLHGLPASAAQFDLGSRDYGQLVDELLASPHYGERWGRHWLDVARYADTKDGVLMYGEGRMRPFAYTYRDYVIRSFNEDKPFDRFVQEQLAADQLGLAADAPELAGLGFLTLGRMFDRNPHDVIDDQIDTVTRGFLGLTVSCARCHDHKFDPIPIDDYYSLYGVFANCEQPYVRPRIEAPSPEGQAFEEQYSEKVAAIETMQQEQYEQLTRTARERISDYLVHVATSEPDISETGTFFLSLPPDALRPQIVYRWRQLLRQRLVVDDPVFGPWHDLQQTMAIRGDDWRRRGVDERVIVALLHAKPESLADVARAYGELLTSVVTEGKPSDDPLASLVVGRSSPNWFPRSAVWYYMSRGEKDKYRGLINGLDVASTQSPHAAARAMVVQDSEVIREPVVFLRGNPTQPDRQVPRQFLSVVASVPRAAFRSGSGRLELAQAITSDDNPLTARVLANRIWMHHFGEPLVASPSDFGLRTAPPTHRELLDWLASELQQKDWRLKAMHRLIMTSAVYQRASRLPTTPLFHQQQRIDPENRWLWKAHRRRLDFESMRDTMLAVSGQLDSSMYGRPASVSSLRNRRRTVYAIVERQSVPDVVRNFDFASPDASVGRRNVTTVPQQALFAMNSAFVTRASEGLAEHTAGIAARDHRITRLYQALFGRGASAEEQRWGEEYLLEASWSHYAQVLLMSNELMYVD